MASAAAASAVVDLRAPPFTNSLEFLADWSISPERSVIPEGERMTIKTLIVNTISGTAAAEKITQEDGVIRAKSSPKPKPKTHDAWRLYFELENREQLHRLHSRLERAQEERLGESIPDGMEGHYYH